ncbi:MAG: phosphotransbutyrylase [Bacillota bacterium]|jgi:VanZ family protein|nr:phosphotransbutyrylase [Bacillota bacterium]
MKKTKNRIISWLPVILWMLIIFLFSSQPASDSDGFSRGFTSILIDIIGRILPIDVVTSTGADVIAKYNHIVRKLAHFTVYLILSILVANALENNKKFNYKIFLYSLLICVFYAISDEFHQLFVSGRGCQIKDVLIDSIGSFMGLVIYSVIKNLYKKINNY